MSMRSNSEPEIRFCYLLIMPAEQDGCVRHEPFNREDAEGIPTPDPLLAGRSCGSSAGVAITLATFITNNRGRDQQGAIFSEAVLNKGFLILAHESTSWTKLSNHAFPQRVDHTLDLGCSRLRRWPTVTWLVPWAT